MRREADNWVDYQTRAREFSVGDEVVPFGMFKDQAGRVTAVWPGIGMVDVEMATGNRRFPAEQLQRIEGNVAEPPRTDSSAADGPTVVVPGGPAPDNLAARVAGAYEKKSLYWAARDRQYRMNRSEMESGKPTCPRCEGHPPLKKCVYKRRDGSSNPLLGCPGCLFLIKDLDIVNHPAHAEDHD